MIVRINSKDYVAVPMEDLIVFEGMSTPKEKVDGTMSESKAYKFVKIDRRLANTVTFVDQLKAKGVRVNPGKQTASVAAVPANAKIEIIEN